MQFERGRQRNQWPDCGDEADVGRGHDGGDQEVVGRGRDGGALRLLTSVGLRRHFQGKLNAYQQPMDPGDYKNVYGNPRLQRPNITLKMSYLKKF